MRPTSRRSGCTALPSSARAARSRATSRPSCRASRRRWPQLRGWTPRADGGAHRRQRQRRVAAAGTPCWSPIERSRGDATACAAWRRWSPPTRGCSCSAASRARPRWRRRSTTPTRATSSGRSCRRCGASTCVRCRTQRAWSRCARRGLGIWDVYATCRREGSLDSAIEDAVPNDLAACAAALPRLRAIAHNGGESARAMRVHAHSWRVRCSRLPSSSPANASWSLARKRRRPGARCSRVAWGSCPMIVSTRADAARAARRSPRYDGVRYLHLGTPWVQGAMRIREPQHGGARVRAAHAGLDAVAARPRRWASGHAVQLGLGAAAITRFMPAQLRMRTTAVELNPAVIAACRRWFRLPRRRRAPVGGAGRRRSRGCAAPAHRAASVSALCVDLYDHEAAAPVLDDEAFYAALPRACWPTAA